MGRTIGRMSRMSRMGRVTAATVMTVLSVGCDDLTITTLEFTTWGGTHIGLVITVTGGTVEYDCAEGEILEPLRLNNGRFSALGLHYAGMGGPIGVDKTNPRPARYEGTVKGDEMTMTVTLTDTNQPVGTFKLVRGADPHVFKCL